LLGVWLLSYASKFILKAANAYTTVMQDLARKLSSAVNLEEVMQTGRMTLETQLQTKVWISFEIRYFI
jgi:two-component system sensor histidine kinase KdpD